MKKAHRTILLTLIGVLLAGIVGVRVFAQGIWNPGTDPGQLPDTFAAPLNTTGVEQTKTGLFTLNGSATVTNEFTTFGNVCWNDSGSGANCRNGWQSVGSQSFVHLYPSSGGPDVGYPKLIGSGENEYSLQVKAGAPDPGRITRGIQAGSSLSAIGFSAGVVAEAMSDRTYGVYGMADNNAWAGYFVGNVRIFGNGDLIVGPTNTPEVQTARNNNVSEICLGNDCRSDWAAGTSSIWALAYASDPTKTTLWPGSDLSGSRNLAIGGNDSNAKFYVETLPTGSASLPTVANLSVQGSSAFTSITIGTPAGLPTTVTCGDGRCNNGENDTFCSPRTAPACSSYCPEDCDVAPPDNIADVEHVTDRSQKTMTFIWENPLDVDLAGIRVVRTVNSEPSGPADPTAFVTDLVPAPTYWTTSQFSLNTQYYFTFYAFDTARNYSAGHIESIMLSSPGGGGQPGPGTGL